LTGGRIVDGTGNNWFYGDLAIRDGKSARIAPAGVLRNAAARVRTDVSGLIVAPRASSIFRANRTPSSRRRTAA
jgi:N-acyl-D-aspartate/D-glutamate deacylase